MGPYSIRPCYLKLWSVAYIYQSMARLQDDGIMKYWSMNNHVNATMVGKL